MSESVTYRDAGVDLEKADRVSTKIKSMVRDTYSPRVMNSGPGFAGIFSLNYDDKIFANNYDDPVLLGATDGVGTKLKVAFMAGKHDTIGVDLVAMSINDLMVQGAEPLFFLDYISSGELQEHVIQDLVKGIVRGCKESGCALLGGETAEMPGFYDSGEYDLAGFSVGVAEKRRLITGDKISPGDVVIGFPSAGIHANGFSLVRMVLLRQAGMELDEEPGPLERPLGEELLTPTKIYARPIRALLNHYRERMPVKGLAHITGGGLYDNVARVLPEDTRAVLDPSSWPRPVIFDLVRETGNVELDEMYRSFNMGIGMTLICDPYFADAICRHVSDWEPNARIIGEIRDGKGGVKIKGT